MKPRDIFKLIVATAGLILFCMGAYIAISSVITTVVYSDRGHLTTGFIVIQGVVLIVLGVLIMKGQLPLVDMAYPPDATQPQPQEKTVDEAKDIA
jgi:hypothetical protein